MRTIIKALLKGISGFMLVMSLALSFAPATVTEANALGPDYERFDLVQMRLARTMMNIAPDFTVRRYAQMTGASQDTIRTRLDQIAAGAPVIAQRAVPAETIPSARRTDAGGAVFVRVE